MKCNFKVKGLKLKQQLWIVVVGVLLITMTFSFVISQILYERLYVDYVKSSLSTYTEGVALDYDGGEISTDLRENVEWLNDKIKGEIFIVNNPKELSACLPFEMEYDSLITSEERQSLLNGERIMKQDYVDRFQRDIIAVIYPLLDKGNLEGIVYAYSPVNGMFEFGKIFTTFWIISSGLFMIIVFYFGAKIINNIVKPLKEMEDGARKLAKGDFSTVILANGSNEIASLAKAFNQMSSALHQEDIRTRDFLGDVSHELRTPLSYVKGYTQALLDDLVITKEDQKKYLKLIARETNRIQVLVQDLLDLTKLESKTFVINPVPLVFSQCIEDVMGKYDSILREKNLTLQMFLDPEIIINGDETRLEQIIQNIVENSIRYAHLNSIIHVELKVEDSNCILSISDNGIGMSKEDVKNITKRFYRVNKARSSFDGGSGIGLSIVDKLMELHGGKMVIHSELNVGTQVQLIFPIYNDEIS